MDLDKPQDYKSLDSLGVMEALSLFPDQIKECFKQAYSAEIPQLTPKAIVISGMGGSSNAAKILQGLFESDLKIPFEVFNDYGLPAWVNSETLVVANSYSGNTEETLSAIVAAKAVGATILGAATGGIISDMIKSGEIHGAVVTPGATNPPNFPKSGLGVSLGALLGILLKSGVLPITEGQIYLALSELVEIRKSWLIDIPSNQNDAKKLATWFSDSVPVLFSGRPLLGSLNAGRNVMCEVGRTFTLFFDFPEVNHVLVEATQKPGFVKEKMKYLIFESEFNTERVKLRYEVSKKIFTEQGLSCATFKLKGSTKLVQSLELPHLAAWIGYYLSVINGDDPGPEPWILKLKDSLSQPLH